MTHVLIVGAGGAGLAAAIDAARAGATVTVIEKSAAIGGASAASGGEFYLGCTDLQRALGFDDTVAGMTAYLIAALGPGADEERIAAYAAGSAEHYGWLCEVGLEFEPSFDDGLAWLPRVGCGLFWLGENAAPFADLTTPVPRGHRPKGGHFAGRAVIEALGTAAAGLGVETRLETGLRCLLVEHGSVVGAVVRHAGADEEIRADAVVLATGGFVDNSAMVAECSPVLVGHGAVSNGTDDGSGIRAAVELGAATRNLEACQAVLTAVPLLAAGGMLVDGAGQRFCNEDGYPGRFSQAAIRRPGPIWLITDEAGLEAVSEEDRWGVRPTHGAETIEELESELGLPTGALQRTVADYNEHAARGADPVWHKAARWLRPLSAPFAAIDTR